MAMLDYFEKDCLFHFGTDKFIGMVLMGFGSHLYPSYGLTYTIFSFINRNF